MRELALMTVGILLVGCADSGYDNDLAPVDSLDGSPRGVPASPCGYQTVEIDVDTPLEVSWATLSMDLEGNAVTPPGDDAGLVLLNLVFDASTALSECVDGFVGTDVASSHHIPITPLRATISSDYFPDPGGAALLLLEEYGVVVTAALLMPTDESTVSNVEL